jgi:hypothetical protein
VFGSGENIYYNGPGECTITCKDGIVHAIGIWNNDYPEGWDITISSL